MDERCRIGTDVDEAGRLEIRAHLARRPPRHTPGVEQETFECQFLGGAAHAVDRLVRPDHRRRDPAAGPQGVAGGRQCGLPRRLRSSEDLPDGRGRRVARHPTRDREPVAGAQRPVVEAVLELIGTDPPSPGRRPGGPATPRGAWPATPRTGTTHPRTTQPRRTPRGRREPPKPGPVGHRPARPHPGRWPAAAAPPVRRRVRPRSTAAPSAIRCRSSRGEVAPCQAGAAAQGAREPSSPDRGLAVAR